MNTVLGVISRGRYRLPNEFNKSNSLFHMVCHHPVDLGRVGGLVLAEEVDYTIEGNAVVIPYLVRSGLPNDIVSFHWIPKEPTLKEEDINRAINNFLTPVQPTKKEKVHDNTA